MAKQEWSFIHALYPDEFKGKCPPADFAGMMSFVWPFFGIPEDVAYVLEGVRVDGDYGWVTLHFEKDGIRTEFIDDDATEPTAVWLDGEWRIYVAPEELAKENPCRLDFTFDGPTATPTVPLTPYALGESIALDVSKLPTLLGEPTLSGQITVQFLSSVRVGAIQDRFCGTGTQEAQGIFVAIYYIVTNDMANSRIQPATQLNAGFELFDEDERHWTTGSVSRHCFIEANFADEFADADGPEHWVEPGFEGTTVIVFDVPQEAKGLRLRSYDLGIEINLE